MRKLRLDLSELRVETFGTPQVQRGPGTVHAAAPVLRGKERSATDEACWGNTDSGCCSYIFTNCCTDLYTAACCTAYTVDCC